MSQKKEIKLCRQQSINLASFSDMRDTFSYMKSTFETHTTFLMTYFPCPLSRSCQQTTPVPLLLLLSVCVRGEIIIIMIPLTKVICEEV